ncbi:flavodoxin family protein [Frankia sp. Cr2]|uniref:flavodoxin family protein n=1 Tax=Frankia sp. Cr2 TaxID=3073932 RepID=UPI002AD2A8B2|nr:flavodoxin family protein [Frankia sp. Cr2]
MSAVAVAYHSGFGHTKVLAEAVQDGVIQVSGATASLIAVADITDEQWAQLDAADAIVFGAPTYMGTASAAFHAFAEATSKRWFAYAWKDKIAAGFTMSGSMAGDKTSTLAYFQTLAAQHNMLWVNPDLHGGWNGAEGKEDELNRLGFFSGVGGQCVGTLPPEAVHKSDILTAQRYGRRVTELADVYLAGRKALAA